jgi:hypothetical protein
MPTNVPPENRSEDNLEIRRGKAIWLEKAEDCTALRRVCVLPHALGMLERLADGTLGTHQLESLRGGRFPELSVIEQEWDNLIFGAAASSNSPPRTTSQIDENLSLLDGQNGLVHLFAALGVLRDVWQRDVRKEMLHAVVTMAETPDGEVEVVAEDAVLVLRPGSLEAVVGWKGAYVASRWLIGLGLRRGRVPSQIADDIVRTIRDGKAGVRKLPTTREEDPTKVREAAGVIVFLHGLMSTDAGLFDELIAELEKDAEFARRYLMLGFPHDTLAPVTANANALLDDLEYLFQGGSATPLAFVCHSRGGLVARKVAASLYEAGPARWKHQLAGCITFGTPHRGTPLAENPAKLLGLGVTAIRGMQPGGFMGASDVLALVGAYGSTLPGVDDLKARTAIGRDGGRTTFIDDLREKERVNAEQRTCQLPILAIGGKGPHESRIEWITGGTFRGVPHDCAVELSSSAPERSVGVVRHEVHSDHFSYFAWRKGFEEAIAFLQFVLGYQARAKMAAGTSPAPSPTASTPTTTPTAPPGWVFTPGGMMRARP